MTAQNLETVPMRLVGRLLEEGLVVESAWISMTATKELALFAYFTVYPFSLEEGVSKKLRAVVEQAAVYLDQHKDLKYFLAEVQRPNGFQTKPSARFKLNSSDIMRYHREEISFENLLAASAEHDNADWQPGLGGTGCWSSEIARSSISALADERRKWKISTLLNRVPELVHGALEYQGVPVASVDIRNDKEGVLSLYVEFPIDEETENMKPQWMVSIVNCVSCYLKEFPVIARLIVWTRPEYEDAMAAISTFYVSSQDVLAWREKAQDIQELLDKSVSYNPRAHHQP